MANLCARKDHYSSASLHVASGDRRSKPLCLADAAFGRLDVAVSCYQPLCAASVQEKRTTIAMVQREFSLHRRGDSAGVLSFQPNRKNSRYGYTRGFYGGKLLPYCRHGR